MIQASHVTYVDRAARSAVKAGLRYLIDTVPGIRRKRNGKSFAYFSPSSRRIRAAGTLARIRALAVPPAWTNVWISPYRDSHLQATGRDAKGRKQYRYHADWSETRDLDKYEKLVKFARALPRIRRHVARDLSRHTLSREKVLATVVRLLETTLIRVGNDEYARDNNSFGLTTMRDRHVAVTGAQIRFSFRGKSGKERQLKVHSSRLAKIIKRCQDLPGQELFQYVDENGSVHDVTSGDVNDYLRAVSGEDITAKDFRTWAGTVLAAQALNGFETFDSHARAKRNVTRAIESVAKRLGNTEAVCRKCYVHPAILESYLDRTLVETLKRRTEGELRGALAKLRPEEAAVLTLLQQRMKRELATRRQAGAKC
jgi:DNA topoisomerase I